MQYSDNTKKLLWLGTLIAWGLCTSVSAQASPLSTAAASTLSGNSSSTPPPLPLPPGISGQPAFSPPAVSVPEITVPAGPPPLPGSADRTAGQAAPAPAPSADTASAAAELPPLVTPPPLPIPGVDSKIAGMPNAEPSDTADNDKTSKRPLPPTGILFPPNKMTAPTGIVFPKAPMVSGMGGGAPAIHTWKTKLKPVQTAQRTHFNYERQILPPTIYRRQYDEENQHLPTAVYTADYDRALLVAVANNDIDGTRALLDTGRSVNLRNEAGDPLLVIAMRHRALDTARLLVARGADPSGLGSDGQSARDLADSLDERALLPAFNARPQGPLEVTRR